jgi:hypothetical protein
MDASGLAIGMGAGIAIGIVAGMNAMLGAIRKQADTNHIELLKAGSPISVEEFLTAVAQGPLVKKNKGLLAVLLLLGISILAGMVLSIRGW